ncbi:MAG: ChuX/HutX family heme-like substrate-binding protein [Candidatus Methylacidiphilales bacterium]|nr:ChuX/HutX family heme-like substrate-binding protein [Candidatus Methylacidiphilales bacterium]
MKRRFEIPSGAFGGSGSGSSSHPRFKVQSPSNSGKSGANLGSSGYRQGDSSVTSPLTQGILPHNLRFPSEGGMAVALWNQWPSMLHDLHAVGRLLVITRNAHAVLGRYMQYPTLVRDEATGRMSDEWGTFEVDLSVWHHACAKEERHPKGYCYSIEVFDSNRRGIHKVCLTPEANLEEFLELVRVHQATGLETLALGPSRNRMSFCVSPEDAALATAALSVDADEPEALTHGTKCTGKLQLVPDSMRSLLGEVLHYKMPLHVVIGNEGALQSHTFTIQEIRDMGEWTFCSSDEEGMHLRFSDLGDLSVDVEGGESEPVWRIRALCQDGKEMFFMSPGSGASISQWNRMVQVRLA